MLIKMKKYILIIIVLFSIKSTYSQIVPLTTLYPTAGSHVKDLDNIFDRYIGTWVGTTNGKQYTFVIQKFEDIELENSDHQVYYRDRIKMKFKVVNIATNQVIYDDITSNIFKSTGVIPHHKMCKFNFFDTRQNCRNFAEFYLKQYNHNINQLEFDAPRFDPNMDSLPCPLNPTRSNIVFYLPLNNFVLNKQ